MAEQAKESKLIEATPEAVWAIILDFERYTDWAADLKHAEVLERDDEGRGTKVLFRAAALGRSMTYTLDYDYGAAPQRISWVQADADITRRLDGTYELEEVDGGEATKVTYQLEVELAVPLPGFVKDRLRSRIVGTALRELKARAESGAA